MKRVSIVSVLLGIFFLTWSPASQFEDLFMLNSNPRAMALGGAFSAGSGFSGVANYNPAGLAELDKVSFYSSSEDLYQGESSRYLLTMAMPLLSGVGSFSFLQQQIPDILLTENDEHNQPVNLGNFTASYQTLALNYSQKLFETELAYGVNFKFYSIDLHDDQAKGVGLDLGFLDQLSEEFQYGLVFHNLLSPQLTWKNTKDFIPLRVVVALRYSTDFFWNRTLNIFYDLDIYHQDRDSEYALGLEFILWIENVNHLDLRLGYNRLGYLSAGLGVNLWKLNVDYGYSDHPLGITQMLGIGWYL